MSLREFYVSQGTITNYLVCPRMYYWYSIRKLVRDVFNANFLTGRLVHEGIQQLIRKKPKVLESIQKMYMKERKDIRKEFPELSVDDEQKLSFQGPVVQGMLAAWKKRYSVFIRETKPVGEAEIPLHESITGNIIVVGHIDDLLINKGKEYLFELKTAKFVDAKYVKNLAVNFQKSLYFYLRRKMKGGKKLAGIIYNVIQKPTIRLKIKESVREYVQRLGVWYEDASTSERKFYFDRSDGPILSEHETMNTIIRVVDILRSNEFNKDHYYQNFGSCIREWGRCEYFELCYEGGETKENMVLFKAKKEYKVKKK